MVKVTVSPAFAFVGLTDFVISRSATQLITIKSVVTTSTGPQSPVTEYTTFTVPVPLKVKVLVLSPGVPLGPLLKFAMPPSAILRLGSVGS